MFQVWSPRQVLPNRAPCRFHPLSKHPNESQKRDRTGALGKFLHLEFGQFSPHLLPGLKKRLTVHLPTGVPNHRAPRPNNPPKMKNTKPEKKIRCSFWGFSCSIWGFSCSIWGFGCSISFFLGGGGGGGGCWYLILIFEFPRRKFWEKSGPPSLLLSPANTFGGDFPAKVTPKITSVQTGRIVKARLRKVHFSGGFDFLRSACSLSENSRRLWLSEIPCWKGFPATFDAAGK